MKRDMDLIRRILLTIEEAPEARIAMIPTLQGWTDAQVSEHTALLADDGWITGIRFGEGRMTRYVDLRLTSAGHDFLELARNDTIWERAKAQLGAAWNAVGVPVLVGVLTDLAKQLPNLLP